MEIFPVSEIRIDTSKIKSIKDTLESTFRLITFSREHLADDLLNTYLSSTTNLKQLLSIKNAQMEAQNYDEAKLYLDGLNKTMAMVTEEIKQSIDFKSELQLFQLFRSISPESHHEHPNQYRNKLVQIGQYICPEPHEIPSLVSQLFYNMNRINEPLIRAVYFHHELIRIHPFIDGNGRTTRIAKNWMLMYSLYPPIFLRDDQEKKIYIETLSSSFSKLNKNPREWNSDLDNFFNQEIDRVQHNAMMVFESVKSLGEQRQ